MLDAIGLVGVGCILGAYAMTVRGTLDPKAVIALMANFLGASLILVSLSADFNLSAVVVESVWAIIALTGLIGRIRARFRSHRARRISHRAQHSTSARLDA